MGRIEQVWFGGGRVRENQALCTREPGKLLVIYGAMVFSK